MCEEWKPAPGYCGLYEVSDFGNVRNARTRQRLKQYPDSGGHPYVWLYGYNTRKKRRVHHLVLEAFVGPRPDGMVSCHYNDKPDDNRLSNLRWDTQSGNMSDCLRNGHNWCANRTHCPSGHPYDEANTYVSRTGKRKCRACDRRASRRRKRRERALLSGRDSDPQPTD